MIASWQQADKAYQLHHIACPACLGAGRRPGKSERCPDGRELWELYLNQYELENPPPPPRMKKRSLPTHQ